MERLENREEIDKKILGAVGLVILLFSKWGNN